MNNVIAFIKLTALFMELAEGGSTWPGRNIKTTRELQFTKQICFSTKCSPSTSTSGLVPLLTITGILQVQINCKMAQRHSKLHFNNHYTFGTILKKEILDILTKEVIRVNRYLLKG